MPTDYIEMMLVETLDIEREITNEALYDIEWEAEYIKTCLETNSIVNEAAKKQADPNKKSVFARFIEAIKNTFNKFIAKAKEISIDLKPFKNEYLDKLDEMNYEGITISVFPHWKVNFNSIKNSMNEMINASQNIIHQVDNNPSNIPEDTSTEYIIKNIQPFNKYYNEKESYKSIMRKIFSTGANLSDYASKELSNAGDIKTACGTARAFINGYDEYTKSLHQMKNKMEGLLKDLDNKTKREEATKETFNPYLTLEENYLVNTDLRLCSDFGLLFEQDGNDANAPKPNSVEVTSDNEQQDGSNTENQSSGGSSTATTYKKNIVTIIISALTVAITVLEEKLYVYKNLIKQVVTAKKKPAKKEDTTIKQDVTHEAEPEKKGIKDKIKNTVSKRKKK